MQITLYTNRCPCCEALEAALKAASLDFETVADADQVLAMGMTRLPMLCVDGHMSVGDAIDQYINNVIGVLSPTTIRRYQKDRQKFFRGIMDIKLHDLTQADVQQAVSLDSKRFAPKSIHCAHGLLSAALNVYRPDFQLRTNLPQKVEPDLIVPENDDIQRLLKRVEGTRMECAILLGACCGCRRSEICGLKYEDINEKKSTIQIRRTIVKDEHGKWVVREKTKTVKSKRLIEVAPFIIQKLLALPRESDFVISRLPDTISKDFIDLRDELGIKCRFHDLRHPYVKPTTKNNSL